MGELNDRLLAAQARRQAIAELNAGRREKADLEAQVEAEERAVRDDEALADAECKIGRLGVDIATVETDLGRIILKRPATPSFRAFQDKPDTKTEDVIKLVASCIVYPDKSAALTILDARPGALQPCAAAVGMLAGARQAENAKK